MLVLHQEQTVVMVRGVLVTELVQLQMSHQVLLQMVVVVEGVFRMVLMLEETEALEMILVLVMVLVEVAVVEEELQMEVMVDYMVVEEEVLDIVLLLKLEVMELMELSL
jgi:preprotein translocase subunit Sec63